ncbi:hypothetical protein Ddc_11085 [Ditylenchus destructor]|nr:hypothetical protein Ddc_11085 [Ditylenchus destructor]
MAAGPIESGRSVGGCQVAKPLPREPSVWAPTHLAGSPKPIQSVDLALCQLCGWVASAEFLALKTCESRSGETAVSPTGRMTHSQPAQVERVPADRLDHFWRDGADRHCWLWKRREVGGRSCAPGGPVTASCDC